MCKHGFDVEGFDCPECEHAATMDDINNAVAYMGKHNIVITVRGGVVQDVEGLPEGWSYTLKDYDDDPDQDEPPEDLIYDRLEYLRGEIRAERISYDEIVELQSLAEFINPGDVELLEAAGVPEHAADALDEGK